MMQVRGQKVIIVRLILLCLLVGSMVSIFLFSAQPAGLSTTVSRSVTRAVLEFISPGFTEISPAEQTEIVKEINHFVRKAAHFFNFFVLGCLLTALMYTFPIAGGGKLLGTSAIGLLYAIADEVHQLFVAGRGAQIKDVCIDFAGVLTGVLLVESCWALFRRRRRKKGGGT